MTGVLTIIIQNKAYGLESVHVLRHGKIAMGGAMANYDLSEVWTARTKKSGVRGNLLWGRVPPKENSTRTAIPSSGTQGQAGRQSWYSNFRIYAK